VASRKNLRMTRSNSRRTISRSSLERLVIGSTAERVLGPLPCDVLVVKPLDFARDLPF